MLIILVINSYDCDVNSGYDVMQEQLTHSRSLNCRITLQLTTFLCCCRCVAGGPCRDIAASVSFFSRYRDSATCVPSFPDLPGTGEQISGAATVQHPKQFRHDRQTEDGECIHTGETLCMPTNAIILIFVFSTPLPLMNYLHGLYK